MAEPQHYIVATAGHVDHGKSALVIALTGTDPDRLPEEKARGITIDLGFAHLDLPAPLPGDSSFQLGIVDVPGHEDFVKHMVAGVGSIDLALFIVAADDGWMPQTEEHLQILSYLGVNRAVVALTKIDLVQDQHQAIAAIRDKLRDSPFADAPVISTSVVTGHGLEDLKTALARALADTPPPQNNGKPRLPVDRVFKLRGIGMVITGTLTGGTLRRGQSVVIRPSGEIAKIRNIQCHNMDVEIGLPGTRTALNLSEVAGSDGIRRGDVITLAEFGGPTRTLDVLLEISPRGNRSLRDGVRVRVHHGSANVSAKVAFFDDKELALGRQALAQLRLDASGFAFAGDRFVLRDAGGQNTLAGGVVLDPNSSRKLFRSDLRLNFLRQRAESPNEALSFVASQIARDLVIRRSHLLVNSKFSFTDISEALSRLVANGKAVLVKDTVVDAAAWQSLRHRAADSIDERHRTNPEQTGLSLLDLRAICGANLPFDEFFDLLVDDLCKSEFVQVGNTIRRATHERTLAPPLQAAVNKLRSTLAVKPFEPPARKQLAPDPISLQALRFLIETGEVVEISSELVLATGSLKRMTELIRQYIRIKGSATVSAMRQELGCSRRIVLPLLERLDREGVTLRTGDVRTLRTK